MELFHSIPWGHGGVRDGMESGFNGLAADGETRILSNSFQHTTFIERNEYILLEKGCLGPKIIIKRYLCPRIVDK